MSELMSSIDQRTKLVGENRLELLMFKLGTRHTFALNVFKIKEVITVPLMNQMPGSHQNLKGVTNYRGASIPVIDLRAAIKITTNDENYVAVNVIITEYNRSVQGFLIGDVMRIINTSWSDIQPPPSSAGKNNYLTAITQVEVDGNNELVEIIDVEKVLSEIVEYDISISEDVLDNEVAVHLKGKKILIVDDSATARWQIRETLSQLGLEIIEVKDGLKALNLLKSWADEGKTVTDEILMMFTDAEMPAMDGYRLTSEVRQDPRMSDLFIALNTSLSGSFNDAMVEKVGCNRFISKFQPDLLVDVVQQRMRELLDSES
ncbi:chemotaxis protein CheV [Paraglaciecola arctica]|uniref:Two-component system, chemotaxis family, response regulator CheV n=1 Tax=Paraglaciecola arctica BSs20135 TaxID=493475 RepID=K6ZEY3_9ALTE|nr:chemotaxis protein CheV [Paraglaciecola arctica]GAC21970.1 two-component system, chemotaxis family, response regulator CheV [Paraglaciecola arctica BSs20135]